MLSNHELPYVGRFACDWLRLATTDPDAIHNRSVRLERVVPASSLVAGPAGVSGQPVGAVRSWVGRLLGAGRLRGAGRQVPVCQEPRYSSWAGVSRSMATPMVSSFSRAISASMVRGTS